MSCNKTLVLDIFGTPTGSTIVGAATAAGVGNWNFPASLSSSTSPDASIQVTCGTNPSEGDAYLLKVAGTTQCTLTLSTSCVVTVTTCTTAWDATPGQAITLVSPGTVSGANIFWTIPFHTP